jgi:hypothetical protein
MAKGDGNNQHGYLKFPLCAASSAWIVHRNQARQRRGSYIYIYVRKIVLTL